MRISYWSSDVCSSDLLFSVEGRFGRRIIARPLRRADRGQDDQTDRRALRKGQKFVEQEEAHQRPDSGFGAEQDRKSVVEGKRGSVRVHLGGSRSINEQH